MQLVDDMTLRKLKPKTQATYLRAVLRFTRFFGRSPTWLRPRICDASNFTWSNRIHPAPPSTPPSMADIDSDRMILRVEQGKGKLASE
jgi:hypothetical protein